MGDCEGWVLKRKNVGTRHGRYTGSSGGSGGSGGGGGSEAAHDARVMTKRCEKKK